MAGHALDDDILTLRDRPELLDRDGDPPREEHGRDYGKNWLEHFVSPCDPNAESVIWIKLARVSVDDSSGSTLSHGHLTSKLT